LGGSRSQGYARNAIFLSVSRCETSSMSVMLNNPFAIFGFIAAGCLATIVIMEILRQTAQANACRRSGELVAVLEFVPLGLRAPDLNGVIPTINSLYNCDIAFFETDSKNRKQNLFSAKIESGGSVITGAARPTTRIYHPMSMPCFSAGLTNWISYRIALNKPDEYDPTCFMPLNDFHFVASPDLISTEG